MRTFLAIDFGTSQTSVAMLAENSRYEPEIVEIDGQKAIPTALRLDAEGNVLFFGKDAIERFHDDAGQTFYNFKAFIGRSKDYQAMTGQTAYTPESLSQIFLTYLREKIEKRYFNGAKLTDDPNISCVIGCPAEWNDPQKRKVEDIARQAGFPNVTHCEEPLGVIYYYHFRGDLDLSEDRNVLVYDFGGGTTDVAIEKVHASGDGSVGVDVLAANGIANLGGMVFDRALTDFFIKKLGLDPETLQLRDRQQMERYSRILKEDLSRRVEDGHNSADVSIPMLRATKSSCTLSITKDEFNTVCADFISQFDEPIYEALNFATLMQDKVDRVILAGGSSALPYVKESITAIFPQGKVLTSASPTEVIAKGLAVYGRVVSTAKKAASPLPSEHREEKPAAPVKPVEVPLKKEQPAAKRPETWPEEPRRISDPKPKGTVGKKKIWFAVALIAFAVAGGFGYMQNKIAHERAAREEAEKKVAEQARIEAEKKATEQAEIEAKKKVESLNSAYYVGKSLGKIFTSAQSAAIRAGTFDGMLLGDYWTINGVNWRIADFDYLIRTGKVDKSKHHLMIVPDKALYDYPMNKTNTTSGGYVDSEMRRSGLDSAKDMIRSSFGTEHILADYGVELMTKEMVFGRGDKALSLFRFSTYVATGSQYWLQDTHYIVHFAGVRHNGAADFFVASFEAGVRPAFALY